jgi:hypothetical protein
MTTLREAAQQALEVLESGLLVSHHAQVLIDLRAALEQPTRAQAMRDAGYARRPTLREMAEPEQEEPVAWACFKNNQLQTELVGTEADVNFWCASDEPEVQGMVKVALYTHPPRREWRGLTEEEIHDCFQQRHKDKAIERRMIARAIEAALKERNV